jgi:hypothetical protein
MHKALSLSIKLDNMNKELFGGTNETMHEAAAMIRELAGDDAQFRLLEVALRFRLENMKLRDMLQKYGVRFSDDIYGNPQPTKEELLGRKAA